MTLPRRARRDGGRRRRRVRARRRVAARGSARVTNRAALLLADGTRFDGEGLSATGIALGEAVFYTGMTGYEEALTDPSYAGQILAFTYPLIGNYGVSGTVAQHPHACVAGAVIKHLARHPSHYDSKQDLGSWLDAQGVRTIVGIDTRALTIALREHGTIAAALAVGRRGDRGGRSDAAALRARRDDERARRIGRRRVPAAARRSAPAASTSCCWTAA